VSRATARARLGDFGRALDQDLNAPRAMAALWSLARDVNVGLDEAAGGIAEEDRDTVLAALAEMDSVLGVLDLAARSREVGDDTEERIRRMVDARNRARAERDFATADRLRDELAAEGVQLEDGPEGTRWKRVHVGTAAGGG
jgi:cysteinyl-tRNA synthetase